MIEKNKKILSIFLVFIFIFSQLIQTSLANPPHGNLVNQFQNLNTPISLTKMVARDLSDEKPMTINSQEISKLTGIFNEYSRRRDRRKADEKILRVNNFIISSAVGIGLSGTGPVGVVVGKIVHVGLNKIVDTMANSLKASSQIQLRHSLNEYRRIRNDKHFERLKGKSYAEVFEEINGYKSPIYDEAINNLPEEARAIANSYFLQELNDAVVNSQLEIIANRDIIQDNQSELTKHSDLIEDHSSELTKHSDLIEDHSSELTKHSDLIEDHSSELRRQSKLIEDHSLKITTLSKHMNNIQKGMLKGFGDIQKRQNNMMTHIETLGLVVNKNAEDISTIKRDVSNTQGLIFDNLTPKQKLEAIKTGRVPNGIISTSDRVALEIYVEQQEAMEDFGSMVQGVSETAKILKNLSNVIELPDDLIHAVNEVSQIGNIAFEAITSFAAGGPLGILGGVSAISSLFGSKESGMQKVLEGQRKILKGQQKIMEGISHLAKGQRALLQNQQEIMEGVQNVLNNQRKIYEAITSKMDQYHEDVAERLNELEIKIDALGESVKSIASQNIGHCEPFISKLNGIKNNIASEQNLFQTTLKYSDYQRVFNDFPIAFDYCIQGIHEILGYNVLGIQKSLNGFLLLKNQPYQAFFPSTFETDETQDFLNKIYSPALSLLEAHIDMLDNEKHLILKSLSTISFSYTDLERKLNGFTTETGRTEIFPQGDSQASFNLLKDYISPHILIRIAPYIMNFYPFLDIERERKFFPDYDAFIIGRQTKKVSRNGLYLLERLQKIVRLSIIQENIISGDLMLPIYHKILMNPYHPSLYRVKQIFKASGPRSILVKNFVRYVMHAALNSSENRSENNRKKLRDLYRNAFNQGNNLTLIEDVLNNHYYLFPKDIDVFWLGDRLAFSLSDVHFFLPEPEELEKLNLQHSDWYDIISDLDQYIHEGILDYSFGENLSEEERRLLNKTIAVTEI